MIQARALRIQGAYLLLALGLLTALSLVALHPEQDRALVVGVVMLTVASALWLPLPLLIPAIVAIWLIPPSVRDAVAGEAGSPSRLGAILAGQLFLGIASDVAYRLLSSPPLAEPAVTPAAPTAVQRVSPRPAAKTWAGGTPKLDPMALPPPPLPCGRLLRPAEAVALRRRLASLERELSSNNAAIRSAFQTCLRLELEYQGAFLEDEDRAGHPSERFLVHAQG